MILHKTCVWFRDVYCAKRYLRWRRFLERCPSVCLSVTDFSHFLQGYLHWGQAYAYWCFDQKVQKLLFWPKMNQFHQRVRGGNCGSRVPKMGPFWKSMFLASIWRGHHLRRFAPLLCRVLSSLTSGSGFSYTAHDHTILRHTFTTRDLLFLQ